MTRYVKKCPRCGHINPEEATRCEVDKQFLGSTLPYTVRDEDLDDMEDMAVQTGQWEGAFPHANHQHEPHVASPAGRVTQACQGSYQLQLQAVQNGQRWQVANGSTLGQAHESSTAQVQISGQTGFNFVHRRHCRFDYRDGQWRVTPIDHRAEAGFTNPTFVNGREVPPGESQVIQSGDQLALAGVHLKVSIT